MTYSLALDPELTPVVELMKQYARPADVSLSTWLRQQPPLPAAEPNPAVIIENRQVPGPAGEPALRLRLYSPREPATGRALVYWIYGGGLISGVPEQDDRLLQSWCAALPCVVVSVQYRLAPENPYPAGLEDCYAGLVWAHAHAAELGADPGRIALCGASAGGGLAAAVALLARDRQGPPLILQLLTYPMLDYRNQTPSSHEITDVGVWDRAANEEAWADYLGAAPAAVPTYASAALATDLRHLPPAFLAVGTLDLFRDEDIAYAQQLAASGVRAELHLYPGAPHGFDMLAPASASAQELEAARLGALARAFR